ncbi:MAG: hypothetical protein ACJ79K_17935 [Gemmatimonadaceae bacterium]
MYLEHQSPLSAMLIILFAALLAGTVYYLRRGTRSQRLWRLLNRSWSTRPAKRFHSLQRSDYLRTAGKASAVAAACAAVAVVMALLADAIRSRGGANWTDGILFIASIGMVVAIAGALGQLWRAATFRPADTGLPFTVLSNRVRVGTATFIAYDSARGVFAGPFHPEPAFASIHPIVRLLSEAYPEIGGPDARRAKLDEYLARKDQLKLELLDPEGILAPTREISILDFTIEGGEDVFRIDVEAEIEEWERRGFVEAAT